MVIKDPKVLMIPLQKALDQTTDILLNKLLEMIDEKIYSNSPEWYTRTGGFKDSWQKDDVTATGMVCKSRIYQDISMMVYNSTMFQHGNEREAVETYGDSIMSDIFQYGESTGYANFAPIEGTAFWTDFIVWVNANIDNIFKINCAANGLLVSNGMVTFGATGVI